MGVPCYFFFLFGHVAWIEKRKLSLWLEREREIGQDFWNESEVKPLTMQLNLKLNP